MSKTTEDPTKYYRTGIAITLEHKAIFDERMAALGLSTLGDLVKMFVQAEGLVELLKPVAEKFKEDTAEAKMDKTNKRGAIDVLKRMSADELAELIKLAQKKS